MTTQRFKTPRKEKMWVGRNISATYPAAPTTTVITELLSSGLSDMGVDRMQKVTVMRIFGELRLIAAGAATTAAVANVDWGIAWVNEDIAGATAGDSQIPIPMNDGLREELWIQQGNLLGLEYESPVVSAAPLLPIETSIAHIDITQQRKQPLVNSRLVLITNGPGSVEANSVAFDVNLQLMLALS